MGQQNDCFVKRYIVWNDKKDSFYLDIMAKFISWLKMSLMSKYNIVTWINLSITWNHENEWIHNINIPLWWSYNNIEYHVLIKIIVFDYKDKTLLYEKLTID